MSVCPECVQGKHANCTGTSLDLDTDEFGPCCCPACCLPECVVCQSAAEPLNDDGWCRWCVEAERCEGEA